MTPPAATSSPPRASAPWARDFEQALLAGRFGVEVYDAAIQAGVRAGLGPAAVEALLHELAFDLGYDLESLADAGSDATAPWRLAHPLPAPEVNAAPLGWAAAALPPAAADAFAAAEIEPELPSAPPSEAPVGPPQSWEASRADPWRVLDPTPGPEPLEWILRGLTGAALFGLGGAPWGVSGLVGGVALGAGLVPCAALERWLARQPPAMRVIALPGVVLALGLLAALLVAHTTYTSARLRGVVVFLGPDLVRASGELILPWGLLYLSTTYLRAAGVRWRWFVCLLPTPLMLAAATGVALKEPHLAQIPLPVVFALLALALAVTALLAAVGGLGSRWHASWVARRDAA